MLGSMVVSVKVRCDVVSVLGIMAVGVMILVDGEVWYVGVVILILGG